MNKKAISLKRRQGAGHAVWSLLLNVQGREAEIARINGLMDDIQDSGAALVVSGDPGIGKTTLLDIAQAIARERDLRVLRMSGALAEAHLPFAALQQALSPILRQAERLPAPQRAALQTALGLSNDTTAPDRFLVALATLTLLTESAARKPILLVVDDAQWLDQPTQDVLAFIARRLSSDPIGLLIATRDASSWSLECPDSQRCNLIGLDDAAAKRLLETRAPNLPTELQRRFLEEAGGNPLALVELPHADQVVKTREPWWLPLTDRLERAFLSRVTGLPAATRTLLLVIAENDGRSLREALDAGGLVDGEPMGPETLVPAISALLIRVTTTEVQFRHPLMRSAVHQAADLAVRQRVHAALARVIKDQLDRRIWHRMLSTVGPDESLAVELDAAAARARRRGVIALAIDVLENAARFSGTVAARSERLLRAAGLAADLGQPKTVERLLGEAHLDQPPPHVRARVALIQELGLPITVIDLSRISDLVGFATDAAINGARDLALDLLWRAAQRCWWGNADDRVRARVFDAANTLSWPEADVRLIATSAYVWPLEHGGEVYKRLQAHSATGVVDPVAAEILGRAAGVTGSFDLGVMWLTQASSALREQGRLGGLARLLFSRGYAEMETGDWMGALQSAEESIQFAEETGDMVITAAATIIRAKLAGMRGNIDAFEVHAAQVERLILSTGAGFLLAMLQNARGIAAIGAGRHAEAYEHLLRLHSPRDPAFNMGLQFYSVADLVEAAIVTGHDDVAREILTKTEQRSGPIAVPWLQLMLAYGRALLALPDAAEAHYQNGLDIAGRNWPFLRGRLLLAYGEWLRRQRRVMDARAPLRTARDLFDALGASPWSDRARRELRATGETSRPREGLVLDALTPQELQIAELASVGLSNREIGARLYLSHRTVGYHLSRIFSKLGITGRSGLGIMLNRIGQAAR
ncbi:DNA-binding CsgD family transcriptional regulator/tetratricopeptide (TPR) repeat protein [Bradyrhizobium elkanii]|uniref:AAA family ATPase n=1 Tax=Bradyrhizobium elkanii TaxID=29448 RepID=UPI002227C55F|nr:LuxR family transcriptional regulator [Bradyrhizobium elkanii]MCW2124924.1 DNA-binding CsgD family transcriptional regulator/tetratricopeptide (TPR) repeat protein [Bradyrhizobium elkanii]MCW2171670.1 DNA-binding CsgD family transcriptional regulator/tetratricopeptide (TPR) repeat protein [Bradyrhizobium elkanii]